MMKISYKDILWALLSGVLATLPFLNFSLAPLAWFSLVPLLVAAAGKKAKEGAVLGLVSGLVFGFGGLYWLGQVTVAGYVLLALYLALYWAVWGGLIAFVGRRRPAWLWWAGPVFWTALEFLRTYLFTGIPWNLLGVSQVSNLKLIQLASVTGVYGVSFLVVLVNSSLASVLLGRGDRRFPRRLPGPATLLVVAAVLYYGKVEMEKADLPREPSEPLALCLVQGGILQEFKWEASLASTHFRTYLDLTGEAFSSRPDLVVWPESALPYYLEESATVKGRLFSLARRGRTSLLIGGDYRTPSRPVRYYNSVYLFSPEGRLQGRYDKTHLVPFGEYVPLKRLLPFLKSVVPWEEDFSAGESRPIFEVERPDGRPSSWKLGVLICYEDIFPALVRGFVRDGAVLLANVTNDAWYGRTIAPYQHAYAALFRAVENRVYLGRSTNTGYSCVIDPWGRVVGKVSDEDGRELFVPGWVTVEIDPVKRRSFYLKFGDLFSWLCVALSVAALVGCLKNHKPRT